MNEESNLCANTWSRIIEPINKVGYLDGAADGQSAAFQCSFDIGYSQGFMFGLQLGLSGNSSKNINETFKDPRKINCQLCINGTSTQEKIDNLFNIQEEDNMKYFKTM
ncbi:uncharacterized protein LOC114364965 [Ostrinia furnacalis]|uniref:uncharacterized protein LOC114364965 n=1 Tax=Ostrinia furnacalis TaxID=93504 RepID=UPI001039BFBE|nr:uncharacterized protein LOC114364965 [Ostrinia furnacalis]